MKRWLGWACLAAFLVTGCGGGGGSASSGGDGTGSGGDGGGGDGGSSTPYGLDARVAPSGVQVPIAMVGGTSQLRAVVAFPNLATPADTTVMTGARDGTDRLFVAARGGVIRVFDNRTDVSQIGVFMDLSSRVDMSSNETGLLGLVFDPSFESNRHFYVTYVYVPNPANPDANARTVRLSRFTANAAGTSASTSSEQVLLEYAHPLLNHFGGWIGFGPDAGGRTLYMSTGDGGMEDAARLSAQDQNSLTGKVLRMRLNADGSDYTIPSDNPFGGNNLVWAMGLRNPWRCSFDRAGNGDLWCGDVGERTYEEINLIKSGRNYGWPFHEGPDPRMYVPGNPSLTSSTSRRSTTTRMRWASP